MRNFFAALKDIWRLAYPYFLRRTPGEIRLWFVGVAKSPENVIALGLLAGVLVLEVLFALMSKPFNDTYGGLGDSIQQKNFPLFLESVGKFALLSAIYVVLGVYKNYVNQILQVRWRKSMTDFFVDRWLAPAQHYRLRLVTGPADNPDQRISEDVHKFVGTTMVLAFGFVSNVLQLFIYLYILWGLSEAFPTTSFGLSFNVPGYLIWLAIIYAAIGTGLVHLIGRPLVRLKYDQERYEANFRFSMARIRENSEQIALLGGEAAEQSGLRERYDSLLANVYAVVRRQRDLLFFQQSFSQFSNIFPYVLFAPAYFFGKATYGLFNRMLDAFTSVQSGMTWFVTSYAELAEYRAVVQRLTGFETAMQAAAHAAVQPPHIDREPRNLPALATRDLTVTLPSRTPLTASATMQVNPGDRILLTGRSGAGKTTLLRALSGIWPFGQGGISVPERTSMFMLPQRTYLPLGTLRQAIVYPKTIAAYADADIRAALRAVGLGHLEAELDEAGNWSMRLSGGEQQRLGVARALLVKPDWLMLDEATSALDEAGEADLYRAVVNGLPQAGIVSVAHRSTLDEFHTRRIEMAPANDGLYGVSEEVAAAAE